MKILQRLGVESSDSSRSDAEYPEAEPKDKSTENVELEEDVYTYVQKVEVEQKRDFNAVKSEFRNGRIVLVEIKSTYPHESEKVAKHMSQFLNQIGGDIVSLREDLILMTPEDIGISRESK